MNISTKFLVGLCLVGLLTGLVVGQIVVLIVSNPIVTPIYPQAPKPTITLTSNKPAYNSSDIVILTATLSVGTPDQNVTFYLNGSPIAIGQNPVMSVNRIAVCNTTALNLGTSVVNATWSAAIPDT